MFSFRSRALELLYSITAFSICQELFSSFFKLFQVLSSPISYDLRFSANFHSLSHFLLFVKNFFRFFSFRRTCVILLRRSREQLRYSITHLTVCQAPKTYFCKKFRPTPNMESGGFSACRIRYVPIPSRTRFSVFQPGTAERPPLWGGYRHR